MAGAVLRDGCGMEDPQTPPGVSADSAGESRDEVHGAGKLPRRIGTLSTGAMSGAKRGVQRLKSEIPG